MEDEESEDQSDESSEKNEDDRFLKSNRSDGVTGYKTDKFSVISSPKQITNQLKSNQKGSILNQSISNKKVTCGHCNQIIYDEKPMKFDLKFYHRFCFRCSSCNGQLDNSLNQAFLCEVEKRFYCIKCCDCKCWLTNSDKLNKVRTIENDQIKKSFQIDKTDRINKIDRIDQNLKTNLVQNELNYLQEVKKCKFCNQILPVNSQTAQNKLNFKTEIQEKQKLNFDQKQLREQLNKKQFNEQNLKKSLTKSPTVRPIIGQQEMKQIRLVKKPVIGSRIAQIIDKLEHSLNLQTKTERKFQENFYQSLRQSNAKENVTNRNDNENKLLIEQNSKKKILKESKQTSLEDRQFNEMAFKNLKKNKQNVQIIQQDVNKPIHCPNCKKILPTNLFLNKTNCRTCTVHCPLDRTIVDQKLNDQTIIDKSNLKQNKTNLPLTVDVIEHSHKPINLQAPNQSKPQNSVNVNKVKRSKNQEINQLDQNNDAFQNLDQTTGICCKCGLKVYLNEKVNSSPNSLHRKCLKCSLCGCFLTPGINLVSPNGETLCNFPYSN